MKVTIAALILVMSGVALAETQKLKTSDLRKLTNQYIDALESGDLKTIERLFYNYDSKWVPSAYNWKAASLKENIEIKKIKNNTVCIVLKNGSKESLDSSGWIQFTLDEKIKYCSFLAPHPIEEATLRLDSLANGINNPPNEFWIQRIEEQGVPTFDIRPDMTKEEMRIPIEKIRNWLIENGAEYDNTEPKLFLPKDRMELIEQKLESI